MSFGAAAAPGPVGLDASRRSRSSFDAGPLARSPAAAVDQTQTREPVFSRAEQVIAELPGRNGEFGFDGVNLRVVPAREWDSLRRDGRYEIVEAEAARRLLTQYANTRATTRSAVAALRQAATLLVGLAAPGASSKADAVLVLRSRPRGSTAPPSTPTTAPPPPAKPVEKTFIEILLVRASDGRPLKNARVVLTRPDGNQESHTSNAKGRIRVQGLTPGQCALSAPLPAGAQLAKTGSVVGVGSKVPDSPPTDPAVEIAVLAEVEQHKVRKGESIASLATEAGLSWQQLAKFNWGTAVPAQINPRLADFVGCTHKTADGKNYLFDDSDSPGIVYVPRPWSTKGLATGQLHVVSVQPMTGFRVIAETPRGVRLPHVAATVKLSNGEERQVTLGKGGVALVADPPPGKVEVTYTDPEDLKVKALAADARHAFDTRKTEEIYRILKHSPPLVRKVIAAYDEHFNTFRGKGLVDDLYAEFTDPRALRIVVGLLARAGVPTREGAVFVPVGESGGDHMIFAAPEYRTVVPGSKITYSCGQTNMTIGGPVDYSLFEWYCLNDRRTVERDGIAQVVFGPQVGSWKEATWNASGDHAIICRYQWRDAKGQLGTPYYYEYPQSVEAIEAVTTRNLGQISEAQLRDPHQALSSIRRLMDAWDEAESYAKSKGFPPRPRSERDEYEALKTQYRLYLTKLDERVGGKNLNVKHFPIRATHLETVTGQPSVLQICLRPAGAAANAQANQQTGATAGMQRAAKGGNTWEVVDWTNPAKRELTGVYGGGGSTTEEAIRDALGGWGSGFDGNRYPAGLVQYSVPKFVIARQIDGQFKTSGHNWVDSTASFFGYVGAAAGIIALVMAPVPGSSVAAGALYVAVFASTTAAVINIAQRYDEGFSNWKEDGLDALTIVSNCLGLAWLRGATITQGAKTWILVGRVAADGAQGIMILADHYDAFDKIMNDPSLGPDERTKSMLLWLGRFAVTGAMMYINFKGTKTDIAQLGAGKRQVELKQLGDKNAKVEITEKLPALEGNTIDETKVTKITGEEARQPVTKPKSKPTLEEQYPKDPNFWSEHEIKPKHILLSHESGGEYWIFEAELEAGYAKITVRTAKRGPNGEFIAGSTKPDGTPCLKAKELYEMMFEHFKRHGLEVKGWKGPLAWDNADAVMAWTKAHPNAPPADALFAAPTWRFWQAWADANGLKPVVKGYQLNPVGGTRYGTAGRGPLVNFTVDFVPK